MYKIHLYLLERYSRIITADIITKGKKITNRYNRLFSIINTIGLFRADLIINDVQDNKYIKFV